MTYRRVPSSKRAAVYRWANWNYMQDVLALDAAKRNEPHAAERDLDIAIKQGTRVWVNTHPDSCYVNPGDDDRSDEYGDE